MPRRTSAGLLLHRTRDGVLEVLIGHMGGPFWARKEAGAWSVVKGEAEEGEDPETTARREFVEELGVPLPPGELVDLGEVRQRSGKVVRVWALEADLDPAELVLGTFELEWPPRSGRTQTFPELDRVEWCDVATARERLISAQTTFLDRLAELRPEA